MLRSYVWLVLIAISITSANAILCDNEENEDSITINRGTYLTFRRYYFISRLDKTMRLLVKMQSSHRMPFKRALRSAAFDISMFKDKRIIRSLQRIEELRNLKPLFMIWDDFVAYKSLEDDVFIEDFSKEIFVVTRIVLSSLNDDNTSSPFSWLHDFPHVNSHKTEQLLDAIDQITHILQSTTSGNAGVKNAHVSHPHTPLDLKSEVLTDEIALRFYYIQRLQKAMDLLTTSSKPSVYRTLEYNVPFKSICITAMLRAMQESGSPDAMVHQWGEMKEYKFIDNLNFVKEFASVVFIALRHMYGSAAESHQSHVGTMSTEELLHAIDIITDQVSNASQTTNDYNAQNLQDWLQHYWWVIPFTVGSIAVRMIYYHYSMHSHHYGMYGSGGYHHQSSDLMF